MKSTYPVSARLFYALLWLLVCPLLVGYLLIRSLKQPGYRRALLERFAIYKVHSKQAIWLHAASLGEVQAAAPLLLKLQTDYPDADFLISCQTPAGKHAAQQLKLRRKQCVYLPFDLGLTTRFFLRRFQPRIALIFETELWPNLFLATKRAGIPLLLINARLTERSLQRYTKFARVLPNAVPLIDGIACQSADDAARFERLNADLRNILVTGTLKWDIAVDSTAIAQTKIQRMQWPQQPIWMAASTHADEEQAVLDTHLDVLRAFPQALLLWAPRHPERFAAVTDLAKQSGLISQSRSIDRIPSASAQVFVLDSLGELFGFMPSADLVFVGGSLQNIGGHNVLEPAALGLPILVGPYTQHFSASVQALKDLGGVLQVGSARELSQAVMALLRDPTRAKTLGQAALLCVEKSRGSLEKTQALIAQRL